MSSPKVLDLGCGNKKRPGAIGVDFNDRTAADIIHNLDDFPYPLEDQFFDEIYLDNTLEHLTQPMKVMEEAYRICRPGGLVKVIVPYFRSAGAFIDPTHRHFFTTMSFAYYDPDDAICRRYDYTLARFKLERLVFNEGHPDRWLRRQIAKLGTRWPDRYERYLSHLYPLEEVSFYLRRL